MGPLMIVGAVPLYNVYSVIVLTFEAQDEEGKRDKGKIKQALVNIVKNPIIDSIFFWDLSFPFWGFIFRPLSIRRLTLLHSLQHRWH